MLTEKQFDDLVVKVGTEAATKIKTEFAAVEKTINDKIEDVKKGTLKAEDFEKFKTDEVAKLQESLTKLEGIATAQGKLINELKDNNPAEAKTLESVLSDPKTIEEIKAVQKEGKGNVQISLSGITMKTAGSTSIGNSIQSMTPPPNSPYLPAAAPLDASNFFGIIYNPNFIINYVNRGRTNFSRLPWVNETSAEGNATIVQEGAQKPLWNTRFKVELSEAKKVAAMSTITEEWDQDLPGFTTIVERLLREEVARIWDDTVYASVKVGS